MKGNSMTNQSVETGDIHDPEWWIKAIQLWLSEEDLIKVEEALRQARLMRGAAGAEEP